MVAIFQPIAFNDVSLLDKRRISCQASLNWYIFKSSIFLCAATFNILAYCCMSSIFLSISGRHHHQAAA